jgi:hypothetical protein
MYYKTQTLLEMGSIALASAGGTAAVLCATVVEPKSIEGIVAGSIFAAAGIAGRFYLAKCEEKEGQRERKYWGRK